ncbi:MAG: hypothetical protein O3B68_15770 [Planctomycetota bacterium]|nr:hypothetical protein [Planctomycetota bacterium]
MSSKFPTVLKDGTGKSSRHTPPCRPPSETLARSDHVTRRGHPASTSGGRDERADSSPTSPELFDLGIDQYELTWSHHGRDEIATNLGGEVLTEVFA